MGFIFGLPFAASRRRSAFDTVIISIQSRSRSLMGSERSETSLGSPQCGSVSREVGRGSPLFFSFSTLLKQDPFIYKTLVRDPTAPQI